MLNTIYYAGERVCHLGLDYVIVDAHHIVIELNVVSGCVGIPAILRGTKETIRYDKLLDSSAKRAKC